MYTHCRHLDMFRRQPSPEWHLQHNCHLLQLPAELRDKIYHFTLVNDDTRQEVSIAQFNKLPSLTRSSSET